VRLSISHSIDLKGHNPLSVLVSRRQFYTETSTYNTIFVIFMTGFAITFKVVEFEMFILESV